ncbi:MAG: hypothetical protein SGPRY_006169, partial [Prymnesium sp.]
KRRGSAPALLPQGCATPRTPPPGPTLRKWAIEQPLDASTPKRDLGTLLKLVFGQVRRMGASMICGLAFLHNT